MTTITEPPYIPPATFDYAAARQRLAALPELERAQVEAMIAELRRQGVGIGPAFALEIIIKVGWLVRRGK